MLGLTWTPSGVRLEDVKRENTEKGYSTGTGYSPKGKIHTSQEKNEKQVFSLGWLATEKPWAKVQLFRVCCVCQGVGAVGHSGSVGMGGPERRRNGRSLLLNLWPGASGVPTAAKASEHSWPHVALQETAARTALLSPCMSASP